MVECRSVEYQGCPKVVRHLLDSHLPVLRPFQDVCRRLCDHPFHVGAIPLEKEPAKTAAKVKGSRPGVSVDVFDPKFFRKSYIKI